MIALRVATETRSECQGRAQVCLPVSGCGWHWGLVLVRSPGVIHRPGPPPAGNGRGSLSCCAVSSTVSGDQGIRFFLMTGFYGVGAAGAAAAAYLENDADHNAKPRTGVDVLRCAPGLVGAGLVSAVFRPYQPLGSPR